MKPAAKIQALVMILAIIYSEYAK